MERFAVVVFRLIAADRRGNFAETGGGIVFIPDPRPEAWQDLVAELVREQFRDPLGPSVEIGYAMLDRALVERHCQRFGEIFWQGGHA